MCSLALTAVPAFAKASEDKPAFSGYSPDEISKFEKMGATVEKNEKLPPVVSYILENGMKFLVLEKHFAPVVSFTVAFKVGNVDNEQGKTGLAHLFEHMAFKGTEKIGSNDYGKEKKMLKRIERTYQSLRKETLKKEPDGKKVKKLNSEFLRLQEEADKLIDKNAYHKLYKKLGEHGLNAMTSTDYTMYVVSLPSNALESWMKIESERFARPVLREFYKERNVVMEEKRMGESEPNRVMWESLFSNAFTAHPYKNPTIGWTDDLMKLSATDAKNFFDKFYGPNNATVAIVGDVDAKKTIELAKKYFSKIKTKKLPPCDYTAEPPQKAEKRIHKYFDANPMIRMGFHNPGFGHPDYYALAVLSDILSNGKTSRFYKALVEEKQMALYAGSYHSTPGDRYPSLFIVSAAPKSPYTCEELEKAIFVEIEKIKKEPPTKWEMERVINNYEAELVKQLQSNAGMSRSLAYGDRILGNWKLDWESVAEIKKLTPKDISDAAKKYLTPDNKTVVLLRKPE